MGKSPPKPAANLVVRLVGPGIKPWAVPTRALGRVLDAIQRLLDQQDEDETEGLESDRLATRDDRSIRLLAVKSGSAAYPVSVPHPVPALRLVTETGRRLQAPERAVWTGATLSSLKDLSEVARALGCTIELAQPGSGRTIGAVLARIEPDTYSGVVASAFYYGDTSIYAKIERVGGATKKHCGIRIPVQARKMVICEVESDELVRQLGQYIYQSVLVHGRATWLRHTDEVRSFRISSMEPPKTGSIRQVLERLRDAGASVWDEVPADKVSEMLGR